MKLIDKAAVVTEIESLLDKGKYHEEYDCAHRDGNNSALYALKGKINTLEVKEVDLKEEVERFAKECGYKSAATIDFQFAKHFFELGLSVSNSKKVTTPDIDDVLKENGVNPDSKEAKIIKESYFMAIEKLAKKGEVYEHGSTLI